LEGFFFAGEARRGLTSVKLNEDICSLRAGRPFFLLLPLPLSTLALRNL
jgi:hypothetical protein